MIERYSQNDPGELQETASLMKHQPVCCFIPLQVHKMCTIKQSATQPQVWRSGTGWFWLFSAFIFHTCPALFYVSWICYEEIFQYLARFLLSCDSQSWTLVMLKIIAQHDFCLSSVGCSIRKKWQEESFGLCWHINETANQPYFFVVVF